MGKFKRPQTAALSADPEPGTLRLMDLLHQRYRDATRTRERPGVVLLGEGQMPLSFPFPIA